MELLAIKTRKTMHRTDFEADLWRSVLDTKSEISLRLLNLLGKSCRELWTEK